MLGLEVAFVREEDFDTSHARRAPFFASWLSWETRFSRKEIVPHVFRVVVDIDLPVLELALDMLVSVLVFDRFRSRSGSVGVNEARNCLVGFSCAPFWERLSIYVRCCTRLAVDV